MCNCGKRVRKDRPESQVQGVGNSTPTPPVGSEDSK